MFWGLENTNVISPFNAIRLSVSCFDGHVKFHKASAVTVKSCNSGIRWN